MYRYVLNISMGNSDLNSSSTFNYTFDISRGNSDLNSSLIFNYAFDVSLRVDFTNLGYVSIKHREMYCIYCLDQKLGIQFYIINYA